MGDSVEIKKIQSSKSKVEPTLKSPSFWNIGKMEYWKHPLFQHSKIPLFCQK